MSARQLEAEIHAIDPTTMIDWIQDALYVSCADEHRAEISKVVHEWFAAEVADFTRRHPSVFRKRRS